MRRSLRLVLMLAMPAGGALAQMSPELPPALASPGDVPLLTLSASGVQIYECRQVGGAAPAWAFRAPRADLMQDGRIVGKHYGGPTWEHQDGSKITGKVLASAPAPQEQDIPWLRLGVASTSGSGTLSKATIVQRINTRGGVLAGPCPTAGAVAEAQYRADYVFLRGPS